MSTSVLERHFLTLVEIGHLGQIQANTLSRRASDQALHQLSAACRKSVGRDAQLLLTVLAEADEIEIKRETVPMMLALLARQDVVDVLHAAAMQPGMHWVPSVALDLIDRLASMAPIDATLQQCYADLFGPLCERSQPDPIPDGLTTDELRIIELMRNPRMFDGDVFPAGRVIDILMPLLFTQTATSGSSQRDWQGVAEVSLREELSTILQRAHRAEPSWLSREQRAALFHALKRDRVENERNNDMPQTASDRELVDLTMSRHTWFFTGSDDMSEAQRTAFFTALVLPQSVPFAEFIGGNPTSSGIEDLMARIDEALCDDGGAGGCGASNIYQPLLDAELAKEAASRSPVPGV